MTLDIHYSRIVNYQGSVDGKIMVEDDGGQMSDFTTVTWQIGLGETLCYRWVGHLMSRDNMMACYCHESGFSPRTR